MWLPTLSLNPVRVRLNPQCRAPLPLMDKKKSLNPMPDCQGGPSHLGERPVVGAQCGGSELGRLRAALSALKRFGPVAAVAAVMLVVFAMGWHGEITLENVVALHDRFHNVL